MMPLAIHNKILSHVDGYVRAEGYDLIESRILCQKKVYLIQVLTDRFQGGITLDECSRLNKNIRKMIEEKNFFKSEFIVEVSSPGVDRPLTTRNDFIRNIGKDLHVYLDQPVEGKSEYIGTLNEIDNQGNIVISKKKGNQLLPLSIIAWAKQII